MIGTAFGSSCSGDPWTLDEWQGYLSGLQALGYNTIEFGAGFDTLPEPLPLSDRVRLEQLEQVVEMAHGFGMRVYISLAANVVAIDSESARLAESPLRFKSLTFIDPRDRPAVDAMMRRREQLLSTYLAKVDGVVIADSDPVGYPGSTNRQFVDLLLEHRKMLDRVRPGIELVYMMVVGWEGWSHFMATSDYTWSTEAEFVETLTMLADARPEPWRLLVEDGFRDTARRAILSAPRGVSGRAIAFNYAPLEREGSFPITHFGRALTEHVYQAGRARLARGTMGTAIVPCMQLPITFAFARGALGQALPTEADYAAFADRLIVGQGKTILAAWTALASEDSERMRRVAAELTDAARGPLKTGDLRGLLFGNPERFLSDLVFQLRWKAAGQEFVRATEHGKGVTTTLAVFLAATEGWQARTGYEGMWVANYRWWPELYQSLRALESAPVSNVLDSLELDWHKGGKLFEHMPGATPFERAFVNGLGNYGTFTLRLIDALRQTLAVRQRENI